LRLAQQRNPHRDRGAVILLRLDGQLTVVVGDDRADDRQAET
jgi:hypothetical protein